MAIEPRCDKCSRELATFGGILLSPPDEKDMVHKYHLCCTCYEIMVKELDSHEEQ